MKTIVAGNNKLACDVLEWLVKEGEEVVGIVAEGKDMIRKNIGWEKPFEIFARKIAEEEKIPFYVGDISDFAEEIEKLNPDIISPCRHKGIAKKEILGIPNIIDSKTGIKACTNIHYGALPKYRGIAPGFWAIMNGEEKTGITLQYMGEKVDCGPIIEQRFIDITKKERILRIDKRDILVKGWTDFEIYVKSNEVAIQIYKDNYSLIASGKVEIKKQELSNNVYYNIEKTNKAKERILNLDESSDEQISRYVRAKYFPFFGYPKAIHKGKEIELRLEYAR